MKEFLEDLGIGIVIMGTLAAFLYITATYSIWIPFTILFIVINAVVGMVAKDFFNYEFLPWWRKRNE